MTREEAYNRIDVIIAKYEIDDEYVTITNSKDYDALRMARELLEQEPKIGHWIYQDDDNARYDSYVCSECNNLITVDAERNDDICFIIDDMAYCNKCGANMIEPQERSDKE